MRAFLHVRVPHAFFFFLLSQMFLAAYALGYEYLDCQVLS